MKIKNFRDVLAVLIGVVVFPLIWVLDGRGFIKLPESVIGATIVLETLIGQFYYRKATEAEDGKPL